MPVGHEGDVWGIPVEEHPGVFESVVLWIGAFVGAMIFGAAAGATAFIRALTQRANAQRPNQPLSAAECAAGVVKGAIPYEDALSEARLNGYDRERFDALVTVTGNPPGPETLIGMLHRGITDEEGVKRGLRQGYFRNDWIDEYLNLQHNLLSPAEVINADVQNQMPKQQARAQWAELGMRPWDYDVAYGVAGNPPGVEQMLHLRNRGVMTTEEVIQGIRESRVKDKYIDKVLHLGEYLPPPRSITTLLAHGALDTMRAHQLFMAAGLSDELATAYVASALHVKTATQKELTVSQVTGLYADGILTRAQAVEDLAKVGYAGTEANLVLDLADAKAEQRLRVGAIDRIRTMFLSHKLNLAEAHADLAKLGVEGVQLERLVKVWQIEEQAPTKSLTLGQLNAAYKDELIPKADYLSRVIGLGYSAADADLLSKIQVPPETP